MTVLDAATSLKQKDNARHKFIQSISKFKFSGDYSDNTQFTKVAFFFLGSMIQKKLFSLEDIRDGVRTEFKGLADGKAIKPVAIAELKNRIPAEVWVIFDKCLSGIEENITRDNTNKAEPNLNSESQSEASKEKSRIQKASSAKESSMGISEEHKLVAQRDSYIPPSRAGKKQLMGYVDEAVIKTLRGLALKQDTTMQALLEEAVADLLTKHGADTANVLQFLKARSPR